MSYHSLLLPVKPHDEHHGDGAGVVVDVRDVVHDEASLDLEDVAAEHVGPVLLRVGVGQTECLGLEEVLVVVAGVGAGGGGGGCGAGGDAPRRGARGAAQTVGYLCKEK